MDAARAVRYGHPEEARRLRRASRAARLGEKIADELPDSDVDAWAAEVAAGLRPLSSTEAAAVGRLAAILDARDAEDGAA